MSEYAGKYQTIKMERRDGILQVTLHTNGGSLQWGLLPHRELPLAFHDISNDHETKVVIFTGTGTEFSGPRVTNVGHPLFPTRPSMEVVDRLLTEGKQGLMNFLNIEVPIISAVNGPAWRHSELPLLADIVLAADTAQFQDSGALHRRPGARRRHAYRLSAAARRQPRALLPADRPDAVGAGGATRSASSPRCCRPTS